MQAIDFEINYGGLQILDGVISVNKINSTHDAQKRQIWEHGWLPENGRYEQHQKSVSAPRLLSI